MAQEPGLYFGRSAPPAPEHGGRLPVALVFPGSEAFALSSLGWQAVYRLLASDNRFAVERFTTGLKDGSARSLEADRPLSSFPLAAVSLAFEEDVRSLVHIPLEMGAPVLRPERPDFPLILAGGPLAFLNPALLAPFADLLWVGEADESLADLLAALKDHILAGGSKQEFLAAAATRPGVYAPGYSKAPVRRVVSGRSPHLSDPAWSCFVSSRAEFKDTFLVEVNRGCPYGCRFCAAGFVYRPPRRAEMARLKELVEHAAPLKVGLVGTALTDWPDLLPFLTWLHGRKTKFTLSSVRADGLTEELVAFLRLAGVRSVTLALEAPSARLRRAANKNLDPEAFLAAVARCARHGVNHLKIYCITGWPGETDADYEELRGFLAAIHAARAAGFGKKKPDMLITLSVSCLVPKPFTPMQWAPMASEEALEERLRTIRDMVKPLKAFRFASDGPGAARLQGLLSRGGANLAPLVLDAAEIGWKKALKQWGGDEAAILDRERDRDEPFPWEVIDAGVPRAVLWREWGRYKKELETPPCPAEGCGECGRCGAEA